MAVSPETAKKTNIDIRHKKFALISVSDKTGLTELSKVLHIVYFFSKFSFRVYLNLDMRLHRLEEAPQRLKRQTQKSPELKI